MRPIFALPLAVLAAAGCSVENDPGNDTTTIRYDSRPIGNAVGEVGNAVGQSVSDIGNATERAERVIDNARDMEVNIDLRRGESEAQRNGN
ncbi:MAG: hypothetical protein KF780_05955 [Sphingomonas sp.]|nr:hypothetical protein [Sphingomonas sp.]